MQCKEWCGQSLSLGLSLCSINNMQISNLLEVQNHEYISKPKAKSIENKENFEIKTLKFLWEKVKFW